MESRVTCTYIVPLVCARFPRLQPYRCSDTFDLTAVLATSPHPGEYAAEAVAYLPYAMVIAHLQRPGSPLTERAVAQATRLSVVHQPLWISPNILLEAADKGPKHARLKASQEQHQAWHGRC
jgi:hypothetical protein